MDDGSAHQVPGFRCNGGVVVFARACSAMCWNYIAFFDILGLCSQHSRVAVKKEPTASFAHPTPTTCMARAAHFVFSLKQHS
jgi:hypothetical protein